MTDPQQQAMPPLPDPTHWWVKNDSIGQDAVSIHGPDAAYYGSGWREVMPFYTSDQMRAYAAEAVARALASAPSCQSKQPHDSRPDQFCADLTCGFVGECSRNGGEAPGCVVPEFTEAMHAAAMKKAVEVGLIPKYAIGEETYLKHWRDVEAIVRAAIAAVSPSVAEAGGTIKEDLIVDQAQEDADTRASMDRMADLLTRTANALRGDPGPLRRWSWHDLPERAAEATKAQTPVAWRWRPSPHWSEHIIAQDPNRAEEAKTYGMKVEALGLIKEAGQ